MAMMVRKEGNLPTLRIILARAEEPRVQFSVVRGRGFEEPVVEVSMREMGAGPTSKALLTTPTMGDRSVSLPETAIERIRTAVDALEPSPTPPENALWLELPNPRGSLYLFPWEQLLLPLGRPILRLPNHTLRPQAPSRVLVVAIASCSPPTSAPFDPAALLTDLARVWLTGPGYGTELHLFTDPGSYPRLLAASADLGGTVTVHDPAEAGDLGRLPGPEPGRGLPVEQSAYVRPTGASASPWLEWIERAMGGRALDVLHLAGHGYLTGGRGAVAMSVGLSSVDLTWSRFVTAAELSASMGRQGTWCLVLSGPPSNYSPAGLRELADSIALCRPGITVVHEMDQDPDATQLSGFLQMTYDQGVPVTDPTPALTCWVHPQFVSFPSGELASRGLTPDGHSSLVKAATQKVLGDAETPTWLASGTRYLEGLQTAWSPSMGESDVDADAMAALDAVSDILERHAQRHIDGGAP